MKPERKLRYLKIYIDQFVDEWPKPIKPFDRWLDSYLQKKANRGHHEHTKQVKSKCRYCRREFNDSIEKTKDHVIPVSKFGLDRKENRVPCCYDCNQWKDDKTPEQWMKELQAIIKKEKKIKPPYDKTMIGLMIGGVRSVMEEISNHKKKISNYKF